MENNTTEVLKMCNSENNLKEVPNIIQFFKEKIVTLKKEIKEKYSLSENQIQDLLAHFPHRNSTEMENVILLRIDLSCLEGSWVSFSDKYKLLQSTLPMGRFYDEMNEQERLEEEFHYYKTLLDILNKNQYNNLKYIEIYSYEGLDEKDYIVADINLVPDDIIKY